MKKLAFALPLLALSLPVIADDLMNKQEFTTAGDKAGDMSFTISLAQTARLLDYCGKADKAREVRDYLQPVTAAVARQAFGDVSAPDASKMNMRGMFLSRQIGAALAAEMSTISLLEQLKPLDEASKKKLCDHADKGYVAVMDLKAKSQSKSGGGKSDAKNDLRAKPQADAQ